MKGVNGTNFTRIEPHNEQFSLSDESKSYSEPKECNNINKLKPSIEEPPELELNELPPAPQIPICGDELKAYGNHILRSF